MIMKKKEINWITFYYKIQLKLKNVNDINTFQINKNLTNQINSKTVRITSIYNQTTRNANNPKIPTVNYQKIVHFKKF